MFSGDHTTYIFRRQSVFCRSQWVGYKEFPEMLSRFGRSKGSFQALRTPFPSARSQISRSISSQPKPRPQNSSDRRIRLLDSHYAQYIGSTVTWSIAAVLFLHVLFNYFYSFSPCYGISMLPTLNSWGDWLLISKRYRRGRDVGVGDIVSFKHPSNANMRAVKRIVGMPGDFVLRDTPGKNDAMLQVSTNFYPVIYGLWLTRI
jgi:signal peptidase I